MSERADPDSKSFKDKWFGLKKSPYKINLFTRYTFANKYIKDKIVLDIPCGMGWGSSLLKNYTYLYGIDISKKAIIKARQKYKNINFKQGNMTHINFPKEFFDIVICLEGFEHITFLEGQKFLKEVKRVLKKRKGKLILSTPLLKNGRFHTGNPYHLCEYKKDELMEILFKNKFKILEEQYLNTPETKIILLALEKVI
jgi:ubiquinone/menaquinone biosynthesis C-methylase UbiE